jgi:hypothetical protein
MLYLTAFRTFSYIDVVASPRVMMNGFFLEISSGQRPRGNMSVRNPVRPLGTEHRNLKLNTPAQLRVSLFVLLPLL